MAKGKTDLFAGLTRITGGKFLIEGGEVKIFAPTKLLKGAEISMVSGAVILMIVGWVWEYLTSTVGLKQDRILEGIDILKTYMEKAPGFVKEEDINTEWDTVVHSRLRELFEKSVDVQNQSNFIYLGIPASDYKKLEEDFRKEEESKGDYKASEEDLEIEEVTPEIVIGNVVTSDDIKAIKEDIDNINTTLEKMNKLIEELKTKQPEEEGKTPADTSMIEGEFMPASLPADEVNMMEEIRNGFNNIMSAFASQAGGGPEAGEGKILTVSLTDESANNISTMIVQKQNEEKALEPAEVDKKGVTNDDLGIEIRDSKRSLKFDINEVKAKLDRLIKLIEEKAMTFDDIYNKLCLRMIREHRNATGRIIGR